VGVSGKVSEFNRRDGESQTVLHATTVRGEVLARRIQRNVRCRCAAPYAPFHFHRVRRRNDEACICDKVERGELFQSGFERVVRMGIGMQRNQSRIESFARA
jgi:hypothetical protein